MPAGASGRVEAKDHRRATAQRNRQAILDAAERLLRRREPLTMLALAAEAGVSRQTLYTHFKALPAAIEALVAQAVEASMAAVEGADVTAGDPMEALRRVAEAAWEKLARFEAVARGASEYVAPAQLHAAHLPLTTVVTELVERGQREGAFRRDLPADWLADGFYALVHSADEYARRGRASRQTALEMLTRTLTDLFASR